MTRSLKGKPGRQLAPLKEKTIHAALTKQRVHAIVGQVIDELEKRQAAGKIDFVAQLADEVAAGGLAAWKSLRDLLPAGDPEQNGKPTNFVNLFAMVAQRAAQQPNSALPVIDVEVIPVDDSAGATTEPAETELADDVEVEW